jgi:arylformamidase
MYPQSPFVTQEEIDLQLDLQNHIWDISPYVEYFITQSERVRQQNNCIQDIRVGAREDERIDVFPAAKPNAPILLFVHGGWWRIGTRKWFAFCAQGFLQHGYAVIATDYTLCPTVTIPDITNATRLAVRWAYENATSINGDPERIFVTGHSAGGHQAGMMAVTDWAGAYGLPANVVKGVAPISGLFDLRPFKSSWLQPKLQLSGDTILSESPLFHIPKQAPPMFVTLGGEESVEFHRQSLVFTEAWKSHGHRAEYFDVPGEDHNTNIMRLTDPESPLCVKMVGFFEGCA